MTNIKSLPSYEQPREKFIRKGFNHLSDADVLALVISSGTQQNNALELSSKLLERYNYSLLQLARSSYPEMMRVQGIGTANALKILAAFELGRRKKSTAKTNKIQIRNSEDAYFLVKDEMEDLHYEVFKIILLNRANSLIKVEELSRGGVDGTFVDPKIIFKTALDHLACSIIMVHNHPSGNLIPSEPDKVLTKRLKKAGELLSISVLDHLIIAITGYYSFADEGLL